MGQTDKKNRNRIHAFLVKCLIVIFLLANCTSTPPVPDSVTHTPRPTATEEASATITPMPATSLGIEPDTLHGVQVNIWHPWFGAEASLFESQVAQFNTENEWGIFVNAQGKGNYSEIYNETSAAIETSNYPQTVIAFPEHALAWNEVVLDLNPYVNDPRYGLSAAEIADFPSVIWAQDEVDGKRLGMPAQRAARFLLYNQTWAHKLGFDSPPVTSDEFQKQACAANKAMRADTDSQNDALGGWLVDTNPMTPLSWMLAFGGGVTEANGYRFLTPDNIETMKFLKAMQESNCAWVATTGKEPREIFAARRALFVTTGLEDLPDVARAFSAANNSDQWTVLTFPGPEREALVVYGSSFIVLKSDAHRQLASWLFIRWMLSAENQARWVQSTGLFPLRASTLSLLADYSASHPQWAATVNLLSRGETTPQLASWRVVRVMLGDGFNQAFRVDTPSGSIAIMLAEMDKIASDLNK